MKKRCILLERSKMLCMVELVITGNDKKASRSERKMKGICCGMKVTLNKGKGGR